MKKIFLQSAIFCALAGFAGHLQAQNIYTYAGTSGTGGGYAGDGGYAVLAQLTGPTGIAVAPSGTVYFCDSRNFVVRAVSTSGVISTVAGNNTPGYSGDGGAATDAQVQPAAIAVDRAGNLYITDARDGVIRKVTTAGIISTFAGTGTTGYTGDGGAAAAAELNRPTGIAADTAGNIYFADSRNFVIRKINTAGIIATIAGTGTAGFSGDGGAATLATFGRPNGIVVKTDGTIYIADGVNNNVRVISTSGTINTYAGTGTAGYAGDGGAASAASLSNPVGLAIDATGNLYIADATNNVVRKVSTAGIINTIAGNGTAGFSGDGGLATHAQMANSSWVALDQSGNVYISDNANNVVRRVGAPVRSITIASNNGDTVCAGVNRHFMASAFADTTPHYQWQVNGINTGSDSSGFTYAGLLFGDIINCFLLDTAGGTTIAASNILTVDTLPAIGTLTGITTICVGSSSFFRDSIAGGGGGAFGPGGVWSLSDTLIARLGAFPPGGVTAIAAGTDTLTFTSSNVCGTLSTSAILTITANPNGHITGPSTLCSRATATYTDSTAGGTWGVQPRGGGTISATGTFTAGRTRGAGNYVLITYGTSPACESMDTVFIDSLPRIMPITGPTSVNTLFEITLSDPTVGGTWTSANTSIATVDPSSGVVYGVSVGSVGISYSITNSLGCTGVFVDTIQVVDASGIQSLQQASSFTVAPNPFSGNVSVRWSGLTPGSGTVTIADVTGRAVYHNELKFPATNGQLPVDLSSLQQGLYIITLKSGTTYYCGKLVKE